MEERDGSETEKVKQRSAPITGTGFHLRKQGVGDKCGKVSVSVQQGKEFINGEIWLRVRGEENVGNIVEADKFHNSLGLCNQVLDFGEICLETIVFSSGNLF